MERCSLSKRDMKMAQEVGPSNATLWVFGLLTALGTVISLASIVALVVG